MQFYEVSGIFEFADDIVKTAALKNFGYQSLIKEERVDSYPKKQRIAVIFNINIKFS